MKRTLVLAVLAVVAYATVDFVGDHTQDRPDAVVTGSRTEIVFDIHVRHGYQPAGLPTATALWSVCERQAAPPLADPGLVALGDGRFLAVTQPAIGTHAWRRVQGCLEDLTLDKVKAAVVSKRDVPPGA